MYDATPKDEVPNVRYVHPLTDEHRNLLEQTMKNDASPRARARAHSLLLSVQGLTINEIAKIYHVDETPSRHGSRNGNNRVKAVCMINPAVADHLS